MKKILLTSLFSGTVFFGFSQLEYRNHFAFGGKGTSLTTNNAYIESSAMSLSAGKIVQAINVYSDTVDIDPTANEFIVNPDDGTCSILKTDTSGNFICAFQIGGSGGQMEITDVAQDANGNIYIAGYVGSWGTLGSFDFNPGAGVAIVAPPLNEVRLFMAKYSPTGSFQWLKQFEDIYGYGVKIRLTPAGNILLAGTSNFSAIPDYDNGPGVSNAGNGVANTTNMFIAEYTPSGTYVQSIYWGAPTTNDDAELTDIAVRPNGNIIVLGVGYQNAALDPNSSASGLTPANGIYMLELDNTLSFIGGGLIMNANNFYWSNQDRIKIASDGSFAISKHVLTGTYDIDPTANTNMVTVTDHTNIIMKFSPSNTYQWSFAIEDGTAPVYGGKIDIAFNPDDELFLYGTFGGSLDLDPGPGTSTVTAVSNQDNFFISKYSALGNFMYGYSLGDNDGQYSALMATSGTDIYLCGQGLGFDMDFSSNTAMFDYQADDGKAYVAKYRECPAMTNNVIASGTILTAAQSGAQYQWYDCNGSTPLSGETSQSYIATANGDYYVEATIGSCTVVSNCVNVSGIGIAENNTNKQIKLYPNPSNGNVNIVIPDNDIASIEVINLLGQTVKTISNPTGTIALQLENEGQYIVRIIEKNGVRIHQKLIVKK